MTSWKELNALPLPLRIGFTGTVIWLLFIALYLTVGGRWGDLWALQLNNLGDFLAGAFAPLAFLWLVIAVLLQKSELELQRQELKNNVEALRDQAKATAALVEEGKRSAKAAEEALAQQRVAEEERRLNGLIDLLPVRILLMGDIVVADAKRHLHPIGSTHNLRQVEEHGGGDAVIASSANAIRHFVNQGSNQFGQLIGDTQKACNQLASILGTTSYLLGQAKTGTYVLVSERISMLGLAEFAENLKKTVEWLAQRGVTPKVN